MTDLDPIEEFWATIRPVRLPAKSPPPPYLNLLDLMPSDTLRKERLFEGYLATVVGRGKILDSILHPAKLTLDDPNSTESDIKWHLDLIVRTLYRCDGTELFDKYRLEGIIKGLVQRLNLPLKRFHSL